jgi:hypothetical protein
MDKLLTHYSYDECSDENLLFEKLDQLVEDSKISYKIEEKYIFKIEDLELTDEDIDDLLQTFDDLNVLEYFGYDSNDDFDDFDDFEDFEDSDDDYTKKRYRSDDDYDF